MLSYAQNREDVVLDRVFADVSSGRYIDAGAGHPLLRSITYHFYLKGWRGLLVEPHPELCGLIRWRRPDDDVEQAGLADAPGGSQIFYCTKPWGYSTLRSELAEHRESEYQVQIRTTTLNALLQDRLWPDAEDIHFLVLDVEGSEELAIRGLDLQRYRPWLILVESIDPVGRSINRGSWEHHMRTAGYTLELFDGVTDYYLAEEQDHLRPRIYPACSTDTYEVYLPPKPAVTRDQASASAIDALKRFALDPSMDPTDLAAIGSDLQSARELHRYVDDLMHVDSDQLRALAEVFRLLAVRLDLADESRLGLDL